MRKAVFWKCPALSGMVSLWLARWSPKWLESALSHCKTTSDRWSILRVLEDLAASDVP